MTANELEVELKKLGLEVYQTCNTVTGRRVPAPTKVCNAVAVQRAAAPMAPIRLSSGVPSSSDTNSTPAACVPRSNCSASSGLISTVGPWP